MRHQDSTYAAMTEAELLEMEAREHDQKYARGRPFYSPTLAFTPEHVWFVNDREYLPGRFYRGWRKRRLLQLMEVESLAGKRILDVGCGNGDLAVFFALNGARVSGIEISPEGIASAHQIADANGVAQLCDFRVGTASRLPYPDGTFDAVVFNAVLHHTAKYPRVREETLRVLRYGGRAYFADGLRENSLYRWPRALYHAMSGKRAHGDVDLEHADLLAFAEGFRTRYFEMFCLTAGIKELIAKPRNNGFLVRAVLYATTQLDRALLRAFPRLERYCSEVVGYFEK